MKRLLARWLFMLSAVLPISLTALADASVQQLPPLNVTLSDPCAVFNVYDSSAPNYTRIVYGEPIAFNLGGTIQAIKVVSDSGNVNLKFQLLLNGDGIGQTSSIKYQFKAKALLSAKSNPSNPFSGKFRLDARIIGQGRTASGGLIAQGAQDNAIVHMDINVNYAPGSSPDTPIINVSLTNFSIECAASPWSNLTTSPTGSSKTAVGRGMGDPWNKYAWSMKDYSGGMVVGTKNGYFDYAQIADLMGNPSNPLNACYTDPGMVAAVPEIYRGLACLELYSGGNGARTNFAEIWRFDYNKKVWGKMRDEQDAGTLGQGFRIMQKHGGKLYVGSDLGSFIMGVTLGANSTGIWNFPGSRVLVSSDGQSFTPLASCAPGAPSPNPCNAGSNTTPYMPFTAINTSFRAMASYGTKLYLGTFNYSGGELWSYDPAVSSGSPWTPLAKYQDSANPVCSGIWSGKCTGVYSIGVTELLTWSDGLSQKLVVGVATPAIDNYLWTYNGSTLVPFAGIPTTTSSPGPINASTLGVLKLFASSNGQLYVGLLDLTQGFTLITCNPADCRAGNWTTVTGNGFGNTNNAYAWSMQQVNGRTFLGTFNKDFFTALPRGSSELWYTDDGVNWQQQALPVDWGLWNYGIRNMEVGNSQLFLGTASNVVAPDRVLNVDGSVLTPGAEVWNIKSSIVAPKK